ncbi:34160_t:CDS:2, partial [Gigaspora margarita]
MRTNHKDLPLYQKAVEIENTNEILLLGSWCENEGELEKNEEKEFGVEVNKYKGIEFEKKALLNYQKLAKLDM